MEMKRIRTRLMGFWLLVHVSLTILCLCACGQAEMPVVRAAPTAVPTSVQATQEPIDDTVIAIVTFVPTPTPSITPIPITDSGLVVYDNFEVGDSLDPARWRGQMHNYRIEDGVLVFEFNNQIVRPNSALAISTMDWLVQRTGDVRFSAEARIMVDSSLEGYPRLNLVGMTLITQGRYWLSVGYSVSSVGLSYSCGASEGVGQYKDIFVSEFDEWHTFHLEIVRRPGTSLYELIAYVDGFRYCLIELPDTWREAIQQRSPMEFQLENSWSGVYDHDQPWISYFDDVAFGFYEP